MTTTSMNAYRASIAHCLDEPGSNTSGALEYFEDGLLVVENGRIVQVGEAKDLLPVLANEIEVIDYSGKLIVPGFLDIHVHYPQLEVIASYGEQLLEWLNKYTFPMESKFHDASYAHDAAEFFIEQLLCNGTTTALVFATTHPESVDAIFNSASSRNMCLLAGKVLMDRHAPEALVDTPDRAYHESKELIDSWHKKDRSLYAITPRFAPTSSEEQLERVGQLASEYPDVYIHTHVAENKEEVAWVAKLFPWSRSYLEVYDHYGLLRERSVFAHCLHLDNEDRQRMADTGATMAFCPTSNLFLGSGLFDLESARSLNVRVGLATDIGGGTTMSILQTLNEAYKVLQLKGQKLSPASALYLATLGSARSLYLDHDIGNFEKGKVADFVVLDPNATPLMERRMESVVGFDELFFVLMMLGDDRAVAATYVMDELVYLQK